MRYFVQNLLPTLIVQYRVDPCRDLFDFRRFHNPRRYGGSTQSQTAGIVGALPIIGYGGAVDNQADGFELVFGIFSC